MRIKHITKHTSYEEALTLQEEAVAEVISGGENTLFFVEHSPVYTCGTSANIDRDFIGNDAQKIPLIKTGRGGQITYHGPGQRVLYPIINLKDRNRDLRKYICNLQNIIQRTLEDFNIPSHACDDVGVWVNVNGQEKKIAAIGVRVRKWVTFHGIALNIHPDLEHYKNIIPCGISDRGVTSMKELGFDGSMEEVDARLLHHFKEVFGT